MTGIMATTGTFIGIDAGTTVYKGVLTAPDGRILAEAEAPTSYYYPAPGRVECSAAMCAAPLLKVIRNLCTTAGSPPAAVAISGAAGSTLTMMPDSQTSAMISWLDERCRSHVPGPLRGLTPAQLRRLTGWPCLDSFPAAQLAWRRENRPEELDRAAWIGLNTDYLQYLLSGRHATDFSTGATLHLINQTECDYDDAMLARLGIRRAQMSRLVAPGTVIGTVTPEAARNTGLPPECLVVAGSFDHPSAARGAGVLDPGTLLLSCGTSFVGFLPIADRETIMADERLLCDPFRSSEGGPWGAIFSVTALGRKVDSLVRRFLVSDHPRPFAEFDRLATEADRRGVKTVLDPEPDYSRVPIADRAEFALALMRGAAAKLAGHINSLRARGLKLERGKLVGGLCRSPIFPRLIAEATRLDLECLDSNAGACGAAMLAKKGYLHHAGK